MADNAGVGVGGDGSVAWKVWVAHARKGSVTSRTLGDYGYVQSGVDETEPGKYFTIGIKVPREDGPKLASALAEAAREAEAHAGEPGYRVTFPLVIEPKNEDQIQISWESAPLPKGPRSPKKRKAPSRAAAARGRKKPAAKAKKAVRKRSRR